MHCLGTRMLPDSQSSGRIPIPVDELLWPSLPSNWPVPLILCFVSYPRIPLPHYSAPCICLLFLLNSPDIFCLLRQRLPLIIIISRLWVLTHWLGWGDLSWDSDSLAEGLSLATPDFMVPALLPGISLSPKSNQPWSSPLAKTTSLTPTAWVQQTLLLLHLGASLLSRWVSLVCIPALWLISELLFPSPNLSIISHMVLRMK